MVECGRLQRSIRTLVLESLPAYVTTDRFGSSVVSGARWPLQALHVTFRARGWSERFLGYWMYAAVSAGGR